MPIVYIDVLFFVNLIMDYIVIITVALLIRIDTKRWRMIIASIVGAVYSVSMFFVDIGVIYSLGAKLAVSVLLVLIAYNPKSKKVLLKYIISFYGTNILFGGAIFAMLYCTDLGSKLGTIVKNGVVYFNISITYLLLLSGGAYILISLYMKIVKTATKRQFYTIEIGLNEKDVNVRALVDTGNSLFEKSTGLPVVIVENSLLGNLVNLEEQKCKVYLIPFSVLGKEDGVIMGIKPDYIKIIEEKKYTKDVIIGMYNGDLSKKENYHALINPNVI